MAIKNQTYYYNYSVEQLQEIADRSTTFTDFMRKIGYISTGGKSSQALRQYCKDNGIKIPDLIKRRNVDNEDIFKQNSKVAQTVLRRRYTKLYPPQRCAICGQGLIWNGERLTLILDHIDGNNRNNRLENLRWVCPNCDIQLPTSRGKNIGKQK